MTLQPILSVLFAGLFSVGVASADQQQHLAGKRGLKPSPPAPTQQPQSLPAPAPLTLEQQPASAPHVAFQNGRLTIVAQNSTLGDVLRAVRAQTGAAVEMTANETERVVGNLGAGPARDVLASLLNGSHFNYVLLGSATNPNALERVILIPKSGSGEEVAPAAPADAGPAQEQTATAVPPPGDTDEMSGDELNDDSTDADAQGDNSQANQAEDQQQSPLAPQPNVRTPEQLLQELQRQQQIQQQQPGMQPGMPGMPIQPIPLPPGEGAPPQQQNRE